MNRRRFFFGTMALLAAGCGGGGAPTPKYRYANLGSLFPLGLDASGRAYLLQPGVDTTIYVWSDGATTTRTLPSSAGPVRRVRPDGMLVTPTGHSPPEGGFVAFDFAQLPPFSFPGTIYSGIVTEISDADGKGIFVGSSETSNDLGRHVITFLFRDGATKILSTEKQKAPRLTDSGHLLLNGLPSTAGYPTPARLLDLSGTPVAHPLNDLPYGVWVDDINDALGFVGYRTDTLEGISGTSTTSALESPRAERQWINARGEALQCNPFDPSSLRLRNAGTTTHLASFLSAPEKQIEVAAFNDRGDVLGYVLDGEAFLLIRES